MKNKDPMWKAHQTLRERGHYKRDNSYISEMNKSQSHRKKNSESKTGKGNPMYGRRGVLSPRYVHGMSNSEKLEWCRSEWSEWRRKVFERDGYVCRMCGHDKGKTLQAHHIKTRKIHPELRYVIENGITLCRKCHESIYGKEDEFEAKFSLMV